LILEGAVVGDVAFFMAFIACMIYEVGFKERGSIDMPIRGVRGFLGFEGPFKT